MGIEKLTNVLPKLRDFNKKFSAEKFDLDMSFFKPVKERKPIKVKTNPRTPQEKFNMLVDNQAKQTSRVFAENFADKKQKLIYELSKVCDKNVITRIEKAENPEKLAKILAEQEWIPIDKCTKYLAYGKFVKETNPNKIAKPLSLEMEQIQYQARNRRGNFILARERSMHVPSQNPKVIAIENILKEQYGCKFVSLKDNEELARKILKAYETAAKNGVKTPKNVVVSDFIFAGGENIFNDTILLNRNQYTFWDGLFSTNSDFHIPLHEIMHGTHPKLVSFSLKKIPQEFMGVKNKLFKSSRNAQTSEIFTELNTKRLIEGLNPEEQALFDYLNIFA